MRFHTSYLLCCLLALVLAGCGAASQTSAPIEQATREYIENRCAGVDTPCGSWRITRISDLTVSPAARNSGINNAWCVDYRLQRVNTGRYTSWLLHWANIPEAVIIVERMSGQYESSSSNNCDITVLE